MCLARAREAKDLAKAVGLVVVVLGGLLVLRALGMKVLPGDRDEDQDD